jgi:hypothetical protein
LTTSEKGCNPYVPAFLSIQHLVRDLYRPLPLLPCLALIVYCLVCPH